MATETLTQLFAASPATSSTDNDIFLVTQGGVSKAMHRSVLLTLTTPLSVPNGGTGAATLTAHGVLVGEGTSAMAATAAMVNGQLLVGQTGADPAPTTISGDAGLAANGVLTLSTVTVAKGGTGKTSLTAFAVLCGGTTTTGAVQSIASVGTAGQVLTSNGAGALPTFQAAGGGGTPAGSDLSIQYNDDGAFGGATGLSWDDVGKTFTLSGGSVLVLDNTLGNSRCVDLANTFLTSNGQMALNSNIILSATLSIASVNSVANPLIGLNNSGGTGDFLLCTSNGSAVVSRITGAGWFQNAPGRARVTANVTNATATMSNLTDLSLTLVAGRKYFGRVVFIAKDSTGADGLQFDFNGGSATMTSFQATAEEAPIGATLGVTNATALGTALTNTVVATTDTIYAINLAMVVNAGGTFIPRFAQVNHSTGTATVELGSSLFLEDSPN